jgi:hypothetical protein
LHEKLFEVRRLIFKRRNIFFNLILFYFNLSYTILYIYINFTLINILIYLYNNSKKKNALIIAEGKWINT